MAIISLFEEYQVRRTCFKECWHLLQLVTETAAALHAMIDSRMTPLAP